jgi:predicted 3-demethylubiquinone-9 3-methyltransferase (glyoxalase superfamily)
MQKITPFLWYKSDAIGIATFYRSVFGEENVQIIDEENFTGTPSGHVQVVTTVLFGNTFQIMSAGKHDEFNDAISFVVNCKDQTEIDSYWNKLTSNGGKESQCGWCIDKYGVRWQIVPENMSELIATPKKMQKTLTMSKIIIADLQE